MALSPLSPAAAAPAQPYMANENTPVQAEAAVRVTASSEAFNKGTTNDSTAAEQKNPQGKKQEPLEKALEEINSQLKAWSTQLQFELDPDAHRVVVSIVDAQSGDVIRTVPSDAVIRVAKMIVKLQGQAVETTA